MEVPDAAMPDPKPGAGIRGVRGVRVKKPALMRSIWDL